MLETIAIILIILWILGLVSSYSSCHRNCGDCDSSHSGSTYTVKSKI